MALHVALTHRTFYRYDRLVHLGPQTIRLRPAPHVRTPILSYALNVEPTPHFLNWQQDPGGNHLARVVFPERVTHFSVTVDLVADIATINPFDFFLEPEAERWPFSYDPVLEQELAPFRRMAPPGPCMQALLDAMPHGEQRTVDMLVALNRQVQAQTAYIVRMQPGVWTPEQTLANGRGSCRDSAWVLVQALRNLGYAARFVSGYLVQLVGDVKPLEGPEGPTADFADLHAWAEVYLPGAGWVGLDATSGLLAGEGHIPVAATPDPQSAAPVSGLIDPCETTFEFDTKLTRVRETPRVTRPYTPVQWQDILSAGARVDRALSGSDVRLTMGGEPTFVAATDVDAPEWNTDALGPTKEAYADKLMRRLMARWSPGGAMQRAFAKQYPGEQLPRWALYSHWRLDGEPVWRDPDLLAAEHEGGHADAGCAARFAERLAERLQVDPSMVQSAYEDIHYYLWRERRLPANVVAEDSKLGDALERARLARVFGQGLAAPAGSVLPIRRAVRDGVRIWQSSKWVFRGGVLHLVPGDSPIGLRLPMDSLPWADLDEIEQQFEPDATALPPPQPPRQAMLARFSQGIAAGPESLRPVARELPVIGRGEPALVRTALCIEPRNGLLHVFLPPLRAAEDWLSMVAAIEDAAAETGEKLVLEGYLPPHDARLNHFSVTPDVGVIEVNVHPAHDWAELVQRNEELYEEARQAGLATEKFMLDGRHVGTGGGNHLVIGAQHAADSPFLRRPDLLKSVLASGITIQACPTCFPDYSSARAVSTRGSMRPERTVWPSWRSRSRRSIPSRRHHPGWSIGCFATSWRT